MSTMSYKVPFVDMSTFAVNAIGKIDLQNILAKIPVTPTDFGKPAHIRIYNDSGSTIEIWADNGIMEDTIPAGAWPTYSLEAGTNSIFFKVINILPNPPIQKLSLTIYGPGEDVPNTPSLGNSPVGIGGSVQTSSVQTLSNEGSARTQLVIDIGDTALAQLLTINNDGTSTWKVDVAGVAHVIFTLANASNFLKISQAGDTTEIVGSALIDQNASITGTLGVTGLSTVAELDASGILKWLTAANQALQSHSGVAVIDATSDTTTFINPPVSGTGHKVAVATNNVDRFEISDNGLALINSSVLSLVTGAISRLTGSNATTCGSGTVITHGLGAAPTAVVVTPAIAQPGSATVGVNNVGATTFTATVGAGSAAAWFAWK